MKPNDSSDHTQSNPQGEAEERESLQVRLSEWLDLPLAFLSLIWTALVFIQFANLLPESVSPRLSQVDTAIWAIFALVFALELALAPDKMRYLRTHVLAALSVVLPFVRIVRIVRFARVLRSVSLVRLALIANRATASIADLFSRQQFHYVLALVMVAVLLGAAGVYFFERDLPDSPFVSFGESLWWAAALVTTVNTGVEPLSLEARLIALMLRVFGVGVFGYVAGSFASFLIERRVSGDEERQRALTEDERQTLGMLASEVIRLRQAVERLERDGPTGPTTGGLP